MININQYKRRSSSHTGTPQRALRGNSPMLQPYPTSLPSYATARGMLKFTEESLLTQNGGIPESARTVAGDVTLGGVRADLGGSALIADFFESVVREQIIRRKKLQVVWDTSLRIAGGLEGVWEASANPEVLYKKLEAEGFSWGYSCKLVGMLNRLGRFASAKTGRGFQKIPDPSRRRLSNPGNPAAPLTEELVEKARGCMRKEHYRWLFISFWLGLRPKEVDRLITDFGSYAQLHKDSVKGGGGWGTLFVKQEKLYQVEEDKRWKAIPLLLPEQKEAVVLLQAGAGARRPSRGALKRHLGGKIFAYSGRKGFAGTLLKRGYPIEAISLMMGHESVERTRKHYASHADILNQRLEVLRLKLQHP